MKSRALTCMSAVTLFAMLAIPVRLAAQEQPESQAQNHKHHWYKLVDIGTFGGPASYVSFDNGDNGAPEQVLNNRGTVVGTADTSTPDPDPNCQPGNPFGDCFLTRSNGEMALSRTWARFPAARTTATSTGSVTTGESLERHKTA